MNKERIINFLKTLWEDIKCLAISFVAGFILGRTFPLFGEESTKVFITVIAIFVAYTLSMHETKDYSKFITKSIVYVIIIQLIYAVATNYSDIVEQIIVWALRLGIYGLYGVVAIFVIIFWFVNRKKDSKNEDIEIIDNTTNEKK